MNKKDSIEQNRSSSLVKTCRITRIEVDYSSLILFSDRRSRNISVHSGEILSFLVVILSFKFMRIIFLATLFKDNKATFKQVPGHNNENIIFQVAAYNFFYWKCISHIFLQSTYTDWHKLQNINESLVLLSWSFCSKALPLRLPTYVHLVCWFWLSRWV